METNKEIRFQEWNSLQSYQLALNVINLVEILVEFMVLMKENRDQMDLRNQGTGRLENYNEANEETKRKQNFKRNCILSSATLVSFGIILVGALLAIERKRCPPGFGLDKGVCT